MAKRRLRFGLAFGGALFAAVVLFGCGGSSSSTDSKSSTSDKVIAASGDPIPGGSLAFGIEAETDGFNPTSNRWAISGYMIANAVFDPLAAYDATGVAKPYLAKAFTPSADFKTWTIELRPGVNFSDGTAVNAAAVAKCLEKVRKDPLTGAALANIASVTATSDLVVTVQTVDPWASLPSGLTSQVGMIAAPAQLDAPQPASSRQPIGSGPFVQSEWVPDNRWVGTKNPNYWRQDAKGNKLPYLDSVEFRPIVDPQNRLNALLSGELKMMQTTDWPVIIRLQTEANAGKVQFVADRTESEESFVMFNTQKAPLDDVRVREGLKLCTDRDALVAVTETPADLIADSQFSPTSPWYHESGFRTNDPAAGKELLAKVIAEKGPISFILTTTPVPTNTNATSLLKQQWEACGVSVTTSSSEQSKFISDAVTGNFQANLWRQFGATDPDVDYVWWTGRNAVGPITLNIARLSDPQIDDALNRGRATADVALRQKAYADLQDRQTALVPYIWLARTQWAVGAANNVRNLSNLTLPDGSASQPFQVGVFRLTQTWIDAKTK